MFLFVGLGNPGPEYALNRHNVGFMCIDEIRHSFGFGPEKAKFSGLLSEGNVDNHKVLVLKPLTYMNRSGRAVAEALKFFKISTDQLFVFHDEIELPLGKIRVKHGGGHAGHNGLRDIDRAVGPNYWRVRIGVGRPQHKEDVIKYVLQNFAKAEQERVAQIVETVADETHLLLEGNPTEFAPQVMNRLPGS